jgi:hypothetical protein
VSFGKSTTRSVVNLKVVEIDEAKGAYSTSIDQKTEGDIEAIQAVKNSVDLCRRLLDADPKSAPPGWAEPSEFKEGEETIEIGGKKRKCKRIASKGKQAKIQWTRTVYICAETGFLGWAKCEASTQVKGFASVKVSRVFLDSGRK